MKKLFTLALATTLALGAAAAPKGIAGHAGTTASGFNLDKAVKLEKVKADGSLSTVKRAPQSRSNDYPTNLPQLTQIWTDYGATTSSGALLNIVDRGDGTVNLEGFCSYYSDYDEATGTHTDYKPIVGEWAYEMDTWLLYIQSDEVLFTETLMDGVEGGFVVEWVDTVNDVMGDDGFLAYVDGDLVAPIIDEIQTEDGKIYENVSFYPCLLLVITKSNNSKYPVGSMFYQSQTNGYRVMYPNSTLDFDMGYYSSGEYVMYDDSPYSLPVYMEWDNAEVTIPVFDPHMVCDAVLMEYDLNEGYAEFFKQRAFEYYVSSVGDYCDFNVCGYDFNTGKASSVLESEAISEDGKTFEFGSWGLITTFDNGSIGYFSGLSTYLTVKLDGFDPASLNTIVSDPDNANAPVEWFNLQGMRVNNPDNGLFIRRQGKAVSKVIL